MQKKKYILSGILLIISLISISCFVAAEFDPGGGGGGGTSYISGSATHRAKWPSEPNIYVEVTLNVICSSDYTEFYYSFSYKVGSVWCVSWIYAAETSLKYDNPEPGITTATVHRRFAYWFIFVPIVVDIKCQVHFDENTGLFYWSEIVKDNGAAIAQALMENFPFDSLYNG